MVGKKNLIALASTFLLAVGGCGSSEKEFAKYRYSGKLEGYGEIDAQYISKGAFINSQDYFHIIQVKKTEDGELRFVYYSDYGSFWNPGPDGVLDEIFSVDKKDIEAGQKMYEEILSKIIEIKKKNPTIFIDKL